MKKTNFKWLLLSIILSIASVTQVEATNRRIYCYVDKGWWTDGSASVGCHFWGSSTLSSSEWPGVKMTLASSNLWYIEIDESYTTVVFTRLNGDGDTYWGAKTNDITLEEDYNYYEINNADACWEGSSCKCGVDKKRYAPNGAIVGLGGDWSPDNYPMTAGSVTISDLEANTTYTFKVLKDLTYYNQSSAYVGQTSALTWTNVGDVKCHLTTAGAGSYTFTWDDTNKDLTVTYPNVATIHPSTDYVYFKKPNDWGGANAHVYTESTPICAWANNPTLSTCSFDGGTYYYAALGGNTSVIFANSSNQSNQTSGLTTASSNKGIYYDQTLGTPAWVDFKSVVSLNGTSPTEEGSSSVTITYKTTTHTSITNPRKTGYTFAGWYTGSGGTGTLVIDADGVLQENVSGYTGDGGIWTKTTQTTLYAKWTQDPGVATLTESSSTTEMWRGVNATSALTFTATSSNVSSGTTVSWSLTDNTGDCNVNLSTSSYAGATFTYLPGSTGAKTITVTMTIGANSYTKTYSLTVYERWNIYVHDVQSWGGIKVHMWDSEDTPKSIWPGDACSVYSSGNESAKWYTVTLDSKYNGGFILSKTGSVGDKTDNLNMNKSNYPSGSYWYIGAKSNGLYPLNSVSVSAPTVEITSATVISNTQIKLVGNITNCGGDGTTADDMVAVGFNIGSGNVTASCTSGTTFTKVFTGLTAGTTYSVYAFATNVLGTGVSDDQDVTTRSGSYTVKVRRGVSEGAPQIYAWTDAESCGGVKEETNTFSTAPSMTAVTGGTGTVYKWWEYTLSSTYNNFLICDGATDDAKNATKTADITATHENVCYWYKSSSSTAAKEDRYDVMDCPITTPQLYIEENAGEGDYYYEPMSGTTTLTKKMTLAAKSSYKFKIVYQTEYYGKTSATVTRSSAGVNDLAVDAGYITITTDAAGDYTFNFTTAGKDLTVTYQTAYTVDFGASTGGTISASATSAGATMETGDYVAAGDDVSFTQSNDEGYSFKEWNSQADGEGSPLDDDPDGYTISTIAADADVYAIFTENMTHVVLEHNIHGHVENGSGATITSVDAGMYTTASITAVPDAGYYFAGWEQKEGQSDEYTIPGAHGESNTTIAVTGNGNIVASGQTLVAKFVELDKIYFRDVFDDGEGNVTHWGDVYAYFGITWTDGEVYTNATYDSWRVHMTQLDRTDVWWAYVPRNFTLTAAPTGKQVAFSKDNQNGRSYRFYNTNAASRGDYSNLLNMFVPYHEAKTTDKNYVDYYDNGYWMKYDTRADQGAGYYLKKYNGRNSYSQEGEFKATNDDATAIQFTYRIDNPSASFKFMIVSAGGLNYLASSTVTSSNNNNILVNEDTRALASYDVYFELTATSEGDYTFVLDQNSDKMKLSVIYPIEVGDYRLVHTYNVVSNLTGEKDSLVYNLSDVIKKSEISGKTVSMYLNMAEGTKALKLAKCTEISDGTPVWGSSTTVGTGTDLFNTTTFSEGAGVYKFDVKIATDAVTKFENVGLYTGNYYIKTNIAKFGWASYTKNIMEKNTVSYNSEDASTFNYYYCAWGDSEGTNVKCVVANDYNNYVSDTVMGDAIIGNRETLPAAANVRFSYNSKTNQLKRSYIAGSTNPNDRFLVMIGDSKLFDSNGDAITNSSYDNLNANEACFNDNNNWIYQADLTAQSDAEVYLVAKYNGADRNLYGSSSDKKKILTSTNTTTKYHITTIYDFKTNHLMTAWKPSADAPIQDIISNAPAVMIMRQEQGNTEQITFKYNESTEQDGSINDTRAYGAMHFTKSTMTNTSLSQSKRGLYWISFPFDVNLKDAFGFGEYNVDWVIEYYDGDARARECYWADSEGFWKFVTPAMRNNGYELKKNVGYVLALDVDRLEQTSASVWDNSVSDIYIYFPSKGDVAINNTLPTSVTVPAHTCTETRDTRNIYDSNWNIIGVPVFADQTAISCDANFYYAWDADENSYATVASSTGALKPMYSYMVQFAGTLNWSTHTATPASVAARMTESPDKNYNLTLMRDSVEHDHTLLRMTEDANVSTAFEFNYDLSKEYNSNKGNIWTVTTDNIKVAGNSQPHPLTTTIVPVGVKIAANGEYTFSMPEGTNGGDVWLIDNVNSSRTNLGLMDYTVNLTTGTYEGRFSLEFPVQNVVTEIENAANANANANANADAVRKVFVGGQLYIIRDGVIYNASGARVY